MEGELSDEVEEAGESEGEEEWPSLGLELLEKDEEVVGEVSVEVEEVGESEVEEEWPSIKSIPGLEAPKPQLSPKKQNQNNTWDLKSTILFSRLHWVSCVFRTINCDIFPACDFSLAYW